MVPKVIEQVAQEELERRVLAGATVTLKASGDEYRLENLHQRADGRLEGTIRRATPKVKGKAARKAEKRARRERHG